MVGEGPDRIDIECPLCKLRIHLYITGGIDQTMTFSILDSGLVTPDVVCMNEVSKLGGNVTCCDFSGQVRIWNWRYSR